MKFDTQQSLDGRHTIFSAFISELEILDKGETALLKRFIYSTLNRLALLIAGYYFKKHKDEFASWITTNECKELLAKHLANKIKIEIQ